MTKKSDNGDPGPCALARIIREGEKVVPEEYVSGSSAHGHDSHHHGRASFSSTRKATHLGREIKVRTTYRIEIDGEPITAHVKVSDEGWVHCHGLPNYAATSALDLARRLVETTPATLPEDELAQYEQEHNHPDAH